MTFRHTSIAAALAAAAFCIAVPATAQTPPSPSGGTDASAKPVQGTQRRVDPRPEDPTANLPSAAGSQSELPSGAVTGAGHAYGTVVQPDLGKPGGLEERARADRKTERGSVGAKSSQAATAGDSAESGPDAKR